MTSFVSEFKLFGDNVTQNNSHIQLTTMSYFERNHRGRVINPPPIYCARIKYDVTHITYTSKTNENKLLDLERDILSVASTFTGCKFSHKKFVVHSYCHRWPS